MPCKCRICFPHSFIVLVGQTKVYSAECGVILLYEIKSESDNSMKSSGIMLSLVLFKQHGIENCFDIAQ